MLHVESQRYLVYVPGAPALVNTLRAELLEPGSIVTVRRAGSAAPATALAPASRAPAPSVGAARVLPPPPPGGLTQGVAGTNDPAALASAQPFPVATISMLDVATQRWLVYVPGAPALVNTLHSGWLAPGSVVTVRRAQAAPPASAAPSPPPAPSALPGSGPATITYYYCAQGSNPQGIGDGGGFCGAMASGAVVHDGAAACAREFLGQRFRIAGDPTGRVYSCADTGSAVGRENRDIWFADSDAGWEWWQAVGHRAEVEVLP